MSMTPISCRACGRGVLVEKFSAAHTSIQWPFDARECPLVAAAECGPDGFGAKTRSCAELNRTIDEAVARQELPESRLHLPTGAQIPRLH